LLLRRNQLRDKAIAVDDFPQDFSVEQAGTVPTLRVAA